jgi:hypothetical protein
MAHADREFMGESALAELWTPLTLNNGDSTGYGIGWSIGRDASGRRIVSHGGGSVGGTTFLLYYPDENVAAAIVANSRGPTTPEAAAILATPYLDPSLLSPDSSTDVAGRYDCKAVSSSGEVNSLVLHLLGSKDAYWGGAYYGDDHLDLFDVHVTDDRLYAVALQDGGWAAQLELTLGTDGLTGHASGNRTLTCFVAPIGSHVRRVAEPFNHTVYFWLKEPDNAAHRAAFEESLSTFIQNSDFVRSMHLGVPADTDRPVIDTSYTYSLALTFDSAEDQDRYQEEPAHLKFIEESSDLWERVVVYDSINLLE